MSGPTLADIAYQAGVSQATVSRVLNDKPGVSTPHPSQTRRYRPGGAHRS